MLIMCFRVFTQRSRALYGEQLGRYATSTTYHWVPVVSCRSAVTQRCVTLSPPPAHADGTQPKKCSKDELFWPRCPHPGQRLVLSLLQRRRKRRLFFGAHFRVHRGALVFRNLGPGFTQVFLSN